MNRLDNRISDLERTHGMTVPDHTAIHVHFFSPSPDGPVDEGVGVVTVLGGGGQFFRKDFATDSEFWDAADQEHQRIHGVPMERGERAAS